MSYTWGAARRGPDPLAGVSVTYSGELRRRRIARELAPMQDVWQRLLLSHVPDQHGRCRSCTKGGTGLPSVRWPCAIREVAELASRDAARPA